MGYIVISYTYFQPIVHKIHRVALFQSKTVQVLVPIDVIGVNAVASSVYGAINAIEHDFTYVEDVLLI